MGGWAVTQVICGDMSRPSHLSKGADSVQCHHVKREEAKRQRILSSPSIQRPRMPGYTDGGAEQRAAVGSPVGTPAWPRREEANQAGRLFVPWCRAGVRHPLHLAPGLGSFLAGGTSRQPSGSSSQRVCLEALTAVAGAAGGPGSDDA